MNINKKINGIVTYDAFKSWEDAGRLKDFYIKFSKRPDAVFDEGGRIAACTTNDGNVLWVDKDGQVACMDWMSQYDDEPMDENKSVKKNVVKLNETQLRKVVSESVKKVLNEESVLNEIGDTPAGQWMLGRLAGRQRNREYPDEISSYTFPIRSQGKIAKTTTDANECGDDDYNSPFHRGFDLENNKWRDVYPDFDSHHADDWEESLRGYSDAMASMIRHHANKTIKEDKKEYNMKTRIKLNEAQFRKIVSESVEKALKEEYAGTDWFDDNPNKGMFSQEFENAIGMVHKALDSFIDSRRIELEKNSNTDARREIERMTNAVIKCMTTFDMYVPGVKTC